MNWNQETITQWGLNTFKHDSDPLGMAIRMTKESVELDQILVQSAKLNNIKKECADVMIVLLQVFSCMKEKAPESPSFKELEIDETISSVSIDLISALYHKEMQSALEIANRLYMALFWISHCYEFNLMMEVQYKMKINSERKWAKTNDGSFQHE